MESLRESIERTLRMQVDSSAAVKEGLGDCPARLSPFLASSFDIYAAHAADEDFIVAAPIDIDVSSESLLTRIDVLAEQFKIPVVVFLPAISAQMRRLLIANRRGFITVDGNLYLPSLSLMLKPLKAVHGALPGYFTPSEQSVFLYCLYEEDSWITQEDIRDALGLSSASVSRTLSSLCDRRLLDYETGGITNRRKAYIITDKREYYSRGIEQFGSPIASRYRVSLGAYDEQPLFSGISALSVRSNLTRPSVDVFAVGREEFRAIKESEAFAVGLDKKYEIQVLRYDPRPLAEMAWRGMELKYVDPVTMLLTIGERDERISMAIGEAMEGFSWYVG